jgi:pimeloyl-ACP methyl ester carboxylesterase
MAKMIQDYPPSERPPWQLIGIEALAVLASSILLPFGARPSTRRVARRREQRTVVFVHGYLSNRSNFFPLSAYLRAQGVKQVLQFNYRSGDGVERSAIALKHYLRQHVPGGRVDLVCHSMGGLVARVYLQELGGARRVDRCVTLGTPHRGTYNAYWLTSRVGRELRPDSALLARIHASRKKAARVRFISVVAESDNIIIPRVFSAREKTIRVPDIGHLGMMFSPTVYRAVAQVLLKPLKR